MYRTCTCGALRLTDVGRQVVLAGWVHHIRRMGALVFLDLRDFYGVTQLVADESQTDLQEILREVNREWVLQATGMVRERSSKNPKLPTGDVEVYLAQIRVLNRSDVPPFTLEDESDGGEELRMRYRYLDIRRAPVRDALRFRHEVGRKVREYLNAQGFTDVETPFLISSTPEGARDFVVPSSRNPGLFYALPQSPQTFKQLLMVGGIDRYYQIVRCFRDEDLRADRQPEFTQIDCEMSFVERRDILEMFEGMMRFIFREVLGVEFSAFPQMPWEEAMAKYGSDKPDLRVEMPIVDLREIRKGLEFPAFDAVEYVGAICVKGGARYSRRQIDELVDYVRQPQVGGTGIVWMKAEEAGLKSSADKYLSPEKLQRIANAAGVGTGDLLLMMGGQLRKTQRVFGLLRLEVARREGWLDPKVFKPLWVVDFPLLEWDEETQRYYAMHHPFTMPHAEDLELFESNPGAMRASAYDMVINGVEVGGGSLRIYDRDIQAQMFRALGFSEEEAEVKFGFLMNAFRYGAPPHGGIAFGFDRLCALMGGSESIRDYIAFPKNNAGRDVMIDSPGQLSEAQLEELGLQLRPKFKPREE